MVVGMLSGSPSPRLGAAVCWAAPDSKIPVAARWRRHGGDGRLPLQKLTAAPVPAEGKGQRLRRCA